MVKSNQSLHYAKSTYFHPFLLVFCLFSWVTTKRSYTRFTSRSRQPSSPTLCRCHNFELLLLSISAHWEWLYGGEGGHILYINGISRKGYTHNPQPIKIIYFITLCSFSYSASSACIEFLLCCFLVSSWAVNDVKPYDVVDDTPFNLFTFMCGRKIYIVYNWVAVGAREAIAHRRRPSFCANAILRLIHIPTSRLMRTKNRILCKQKWIKWKMLKCWW